MNDEVNDEDLKAHDIRRILTIWHEQGIQAADIEFQKVVGLRGLTRAEALALAGEIKQAGRAG